MELVYFLLGSNLGDRNLYLKEARLLLQETIGKQMRASSIYETQSWGIDGLPDYLNQVIETETLLEPEIILTKTQFIEQKLHRERTIRWHSRTIDIDILFYGKHIINLPQLKIPHPQLHNRLFTLAPLDELVPDLIHPELQKTVHKLKREIKNDLSVKIYATK